MVVNKKGFVQLYYLVIGICIVILGIALAAPTKQVIDEAQNNTDLNCTGTITSDFNQATCWELDIQKILFVGGIIFIGLAVIGYKVVFG